MNIILEFKPPGLTYTELSQLNNLCFQDEPFSAYDFQAYQLQGIWALYDGDLLVGFGVSMLGPDRVHIRRIAVHPDYRSKGLGSRLMAAMIDQAQNAGFERVTLNVRQDNPAAIRLYEKFRFLVFGESVQFIATVGTTTDTDLNVMAVPAYLQEVQHPSYLDRLARLKESQDPPKRYALVFLRKGLLVGLTLFSPDFPGCRSFEVFTEVKDIQQLVNLLEPFTRPDKRTIRITTRDQAAIALFRDAGVRENYRLFEMSTELI